MKVFDFDNTIYDGESAVDFFMFCLKQKKSLLIYMPKVLQKTIKYKLGKISEKEIYDFGSKMLGVFFANGAYADESVKAFWQLNSSKLKKEFLDIIDENDVIISASPDFLLNEVTDKLSTKNIICTEIDKETQAIKFLCYGKNKITAFDSAYPDAVIDEFYTDSINDLPMMKKAKKAYMVKGSKIKKYIFKGNQ